MAKCNERRSEARTVASTTEGKIAEFAAAAFRDGGNVGRIIEYVEEGVHSGDFEELDSLEDALRDFREYCEALKDA